MDSNELNLDSSQSQTNSKDLNTDNNNQATKINVSGPLLSDSLITESTVNIQLNSDDESRQTNQQSNDFLTQSAVNIHHSNSNSSDEDSDRISSTKNPITDSTVVISSTYQVGVYIL
jgi:hypothetical protein